MAAPICVLLRFLIRLGKLSVFIACCSLLKGQDTEVRLSWFRSSLEGEQLLEEIVFPCIVLRKILFP